jgi:hypothetical protein
MIGPQPCTLNCIITISHHSIPSAPVHDCLAGWLQKPLRCGVAHISFSAHADYDQTSGFLDEVGGGVGGWGGQDEAFNEGQCSARVPTLGFST